MRPWLLQAPAVVVLALPVVAFLFNSFISLQERGFFDISDIFAATGFAILAYMVAIRSRIGLYAAIVLCAIYLLSAVVGGPVEFIAYWLAAIAVLIWSVPRIRAVTPA